MVLTYLTLENGLSSANSSHHYIAASVVLTYYLSSRAIRLTLVPDAERERALAKFKLEGKEAVEAWPRSGGMM